MTYIVDQFTGLPGAEIVRTGLADLEERRITVSALLTLIGEPNLTRLGVPVPAVAGIEQPYEHRLYEMLLATHGDAAYSRYNSLIRRLVSFERALAWRLRLSADEA